MPANLSLTQQAGDDLDEIYAWYEGKRAGLGQAFLDAVNRQIQGLCGSPQMHQRVYGEYRKSFLRRFPYNIYYLYTPLTDTVTIMTVVHAARDPGTWMGRLP